MIPAHILLLAVASWITYLLSPVSARRHFTFKVGYRGRDLMISSRRRLVERNVTLSLSGGTADYGYFFAEIFLGTPPQKFAAIVDTGSVQPFVPCASCGSKCGSNHLNPPFDPGASSSAWQIGCGSSQCTCGLAGCGCTEDDKCSYFVSYTEGSDTTGILVSDLLSLEEGSEEPGSRVTFGCATEETKLLYEQAADGLLALGNSSSSIANQLVETGVIDPMFSICFGGVEGEGALMLGDAPLPPAVRSRLRYTPLLQGDPERYPLAYYRAGLQGILLGGEVLTVDEEEFQLGHGTVLDSGTTFMYLPTAIFEVFASLVEQRAIGAGMARVSGPIEGDICFNGPTLFMHADYLATVFAPMTLQFDEMEPLVLPPINYLFISGLLINRVCLAVFDNYDRGTILGGVVFRNVLVQYDLEKQRVGFAEAPCKGLSS